MCPPTDSHHERRGHRRKATFEAAEPTVWPASRGGHTLGIRRLHSPQETATKSCYRTRSCVLRRMVGARTQFFAVRSVGSGAFSVKGLARNWPRPTAMQHWRTCASGLLLGTRPYSKKDKGTRNKKPAGGRRWNVAFHEWCAEARQRGGCVKAFTTRERSLLKAIAYYFLLDLKENADV